MITIRNADGSIGLGAGGQYEDGAPAQLGPLVSSYAPTVAPVLIETPVAAPPDAGVTVIPAGNTVGGRGITLDAPPAPESAAPDGGRPAPDPATAGGPRVVPMSAGVIEGGAVETASAASTPVSRTRILWAVAAVVAGGAIVVLATSRRRK